jgi:uncharacterized RDD family membrane protein YckC
MAVVAPPEFAERAIESLGPAALAAMNPQAPPPEPPPKSALQPLPTPEQPSPFLQELASKVVSIDPAKRQPGSQSDSLPKEEEKGKQTPPTAVPPSGGGAPRRGQSDLEFIPTVGPAKSRTLKTSVEAVIYCDSPVAAPLHRAMAAFLDGSMIFLGLGIFLVIFQFFGGSFPWSKQNIALFLAAFALIAIFYGFVWTLAGRETIGMKWVDLRLLTFNGFPPDRKSRALRSVGCLLSFCSGMIGIFWALVDEEGLTWHDHMSKTFPTLKETNTGFVRQ